MLPLLDPEIFELPREAIVRCALFAVAQARDEGYSIETAHVRRLMKVARTEPEFAFAKWRIGACGCLLGNLIGPAIDPEHLTQADYRTGLAFDRALRSELEVVYGEDEIESVNLSAGAVVKVIG